MATPRDNREHTGRPTMSEPHSSKETPPPKKEEIGGEEQPLTSSFTASPEDPSPFSGEHFVAFRVAKQRLALPLKQVDRILRMVELIPVPEAPDVIQGLINLHGEAIPAINLRVRLGLPRQPVHVNDRILIVQTRCRPMGLIVESVDAVLEVTADQVEKPGGSLVKTPLLQALIRKEDNIYLVLSADHIDPEVLNAKDERAHGTSAKK